MKIFIQTTVFTSECPRICTLTRLCSTAASISRCAWTNWVSMCRQCSEKQFLSSTLAITDSWATILFSRYSTVSACGYDKIMYNHRNRERPTFCVLARLDWLRILLKSYYHVSNYTAIHYGTIRHANGLHYHNRCM